MDQYKADKAKLELDLAGKNNRATQREGSIAKLEEQIKVQDKKIIELQKRQDNKNNAEINELKNSNKKLQDSINDKNAKLAKSEKKVAKLEGEIASLEAKEKELTELLKLEAQSYKELDEKYQIYTASIEGDLKTLEQLKSTLSQIGDLASDGGKILDNPIKTKVTTTHSVSSHMSKNQTKMEPAPAGSAQNSGNNSGIIRAGDSISNSLVVNEVVVEFDSEQLANKIAEGASAFTQTVEDAVLDAESSVKGAVDTVSALVSTKTPYQVW